jgi:hypothetical protein
MSSSEHLPLPDLGLETASLGKPSRILTLGLGLKDVPDDCVTIFLA